MSRNKIIDLINVKVDGKEYLTISEIKDVEVGDLVLIIDKDRQLHRGIVKDYVGVYYGDEIKITDYRVLVKNFLDDYIYKSQLTSLCKLRRNLEHVSSMVLAKSVYPSSLSQKYVFWLNLIEHSSTLCYI